MTFRDWEFDSVVVRTPSRGAPSPGPGQWPTWAWRRRRTPAPRRRSRSGSRRAPPGAGRRSKLTARRREAGRRWTGCHPPPPPPPSWVTTDLSPTTRCPHQPGRRQDLLATGWGHSAPPPPPPLPFLTSSHHLHSPFDHSELPYFPWRSEGRLHWFCRQWNFIL